MLLGALVDAGVPFQRLEETAAALGVGARLQMRKTESNLAHRDDIRTFVDYIDADEKRI